MVVRGEPPTVDVQAPKHPPLVLQFTSEDGTIVSPDLECITIEPAVDVEEGRDYNLTFNRSYPPTAAIGDRTVVQAGNAAADWTATIFGQATEPYLRINGIFVNWTGLELPPGSAILIDTRQRTMNLNGVAADSVYQFSNFQQWSWDDLRLKPGSNRVRLGATSLGISAIMQMCWYPTWAG
jgi:hypothetical protein